MTISGIISKITGNTASNGGGGIYNWGNATVSGSTISGNTVISGNGGGLLNWGNLTVMQGSIISWNKAAFNGGGVSNSRSSNSMGTLKVRDGSIFGNTAVGVSTSSGGGIYNKAKATIDRSTIGTPFPVRDFGNVAAYGGGISSVGTAATLTVTGSTIFWNQATVRGGGLIYSQGSGLICEAKQVRGNSPDNIVKV
jgi:hypothetical protein